MADAYQHPLNYAPTGLIRRKLTRRIALTLIIVAFAAVAAALLPHVIRRSRLLSLQRQCLEYSPPSTSIVFDSRTASLPALQRSDPNIRVVKLSHGNAVGRVPKLWSDYDSRINSGQTLPGLATLYLHRGTSRSGNSRLIAVTLYQTGQYGDTLDAVALSIEPGSFSALPREMTFVPWESAWCVSSITDDVVIFAGQPDPVRADHFTVNAAVGGIPFVIDGWLRDDDSVVLERRLPIPPSPPSPASPR